MSRKLSLITWVVALGLLVSTSSITAQGQAPLDTSTTQTALGTGFTYQGQLKNASGPVNTTCDFQFSLWDAAGSGAPPAGGAQIGLTQTLPVTVTNSLFTVVLNGGNEFGNSAFTGNARWLQIAVRCPGGSGAAYATLSPRQALTATPYALALPGLRTQPNTTSPNVIGGYSGNSVAVGVFGATIGGGGNALGRTNQVNADYATLGGGLGNTITITGTYATIGGGEYNTTSGLGATVGGGQVNTAGGDNATIGGGMENYADGGGSTIGGGILNSAGDGATVGGGVTNRARGNESTIGGGSDNIASGSYATVGGGYANSANGVGSVVGGGGRDGTKLAGNRALGKASTIGGGLGNTIIITASYATIGGGDSNVASASDATVGGGYYNVAGGGATIGGGGDNVASGGMATIGGGDDNLASGSRATIGGGSNNLASGPGSVVGGGGFDGIFLAGNQALGNASTIGGGLGNTITTTAHYATVGGGLSNTASGVGAFIGGGGSHIASGGGSVVGGGEGNTASGVGATVGGGGGNLASGEGATIGGGSENIAGGIGSVVGGGGGNGTTVIGNRALGNASTIGGGFGNTITITARYATISGGSGNGARGLYATVPGGKNNSAAGNYSFAAGCGAQANADGAFVWVDSNCDLIPITVANQFHVRASGGVVFRSNISFTTESGVILNPGASAWSSLSDRASKDNFTSVNGRDILERLASVPVQTWNWKSQAASIRHIGPVAQDFYAAFNVGEDEQHISTVDADGVALAAIQGLYQIVQEKDAQITALEARVAEVEKASQSGQASAQPAPFNVFNLASVLAFAGVAVLLMQHGVRRML